MHKQLLTLLTRAPLHVGAGASVGAIDQPVIRERHTRLPVIPGSSLKGVLADLWASDKEQAFDDKGKPKTDRDGKPVMVRAGLAKRLFGADDNANAASGRLLLGEARLLAFPVRSAKGCFAWLTCPLVLSRFLRDDRESEISNLKSEIQTLSPSPEEVFLTPDSALALDGKVIFEEYPLAVKGKVAPALADALKTLCDDEVWQGVPQRLAVVSDELFAYFAENACEVAQHNRIDDETGTVAGVALFNQENVPSETLFYAPVQSVEPDLLAALDARLKEAGSLLQLGADETTGLGWCSVKLNACK